MKYLILIAFLILAWCPWLKRDEALRLVDAKVVELQQSESDLCAMSIDRNSITKVPFGYTEKVSYDCADSDPVYGVLKSTNIVFISFYKGILGMPNKTIARQNF